MSFLKSVTASSTNYSAPAIEFRPYSKSMEPLVKAFNARIHARGATQYTFAESCVLDFPKLPGGKVYQEGTLLVQDSEVRGAYILRQQEFAIRGTITAVACGPQMLLSEGIVDPKYGLGGVLLLRHAMRCQPLLFAFGIGGFREPFARILQAVGWAMRLVPFYFKVVNPSVFLRNIRYLRRGRARCLALDLLHASGLAGIGVRAMQLRLRRGRHGVEAERVSEFGAWADALWEQCRTAYSFIGVRNRETLAALYPRDNARFFRLRVSRNGATLGWAILLDSQMSGHKYFGDMRVGSIADCLALPEAAGIVLRAATCFLEERGVDVIVTNQSSLAWRKGLSQSGFLRGPSNCILALSSALQERLKPLDSNWNHIHVTRGDGDGPNNL